MQAIGQKGSNDDRADTDIGWKVSRDGGQTWGPLQLLYGKSIQLDAQGGFSGKEYPHLNWNAKLQARSGNGAFFCLFVCLVDWFVCVFGFVDLRLWCLLV